MRDWIENEVKDVPLSARVICRVYANVRGLGEVLVRTGTIEHIEVFEEFVRGFTRARTMFDFVDVGAGKDRADEKIIGKWRQLQVKRHGTDQCDRKFQDFFTGLPLPPAPLRLLARQWLRTTPGRVLRQDRDCQQGGPA